MDNLSTDDKLTSKMKVRRISVKDDFSEEPLLRHCNLSANSGEDFYHAVLNGEFTNALKADEVLIVNLDGTEGYASSFLDESFGNLVYDFTLKLVQDKVQVVSNDEPEWKEMIENETYIEWEERRLAADHPVVTRKHNPWYRLVEGEPIPKVWEFPV